MKEFPDFIVPQHISDQYGLQAPRGLYASLDQVRLAYCIGADLAAIALCRSVTERHIRFHYASDVPYAKNSNKTKLTGKDNNLIEQVEKSFPFLRKFNLCKKVKEAHAILHIDEAVEEEDIQHRDRDRGLLDDWLRVLEEMTDKAPVAAAP